MYKLRKYSLSFHRMCDGKQTGERNAIGKPLELRTCDMNSDFGSDSLDLQQTSIKVDLFTQY